MQTSSILPFAAPRRANGHSVSQVVVPPAHWDGVVNGSGFQPTGLIPAPSAAPPEAEEEDRKPADLGRRMAQVGLGAALVLTGVAAPFLAPTSASAATVAMQNQAQNRDTTPVRLGKVQDVVNQFTAERQIYVVGNPSVDGKKLKEADFQKLAEVARKHPNVYIVLVDGSRNIERDDHALSRGVANSSAFQSVVDERTGERVGVVFMIYTNVKDSGFKEDTGKDRAIFMRAEELPDRLGVGEDAFASERGEPRELMKLYIDTYKSGKGMHGGLDAVATRVNEKIDQHVTALIGGAQTAVDQAAAAVDGVQQSIQQFREKHGEGGQLGSPNVQGWRDQLAQARQAFQQKDFNGARSRAEALQASIRTYQDAVSTFDQAPELARQVEADLKQIAADMATLKNNRDARQAHKHHEQAHQSLEAFRTAYEARDTDYITHLRTAQQEARDAAREVQESRDTTILWHNIKTYGSAALVVAALAGAVLAHRKARGRRKEAEEGVDEVAGQIAERARELRDFLNAADYHKLSSTTGRTKELADRLVETTSDALTLMGGAEKFLAESRAMIRGKTLGDKLYNQFGTRHYEEAVLLLTEYDRTLKFDAHDSTRAVLEKGTKSESWREQLLRSGDSRVYEKSLYQVLNAIQERCDEARSQLERLDSAEQDAGVAVRGVKDVRDRAGRLAQPDGLFAGEALNRTLLPSLLEEPSMAAALQRVDTDPVATLEAFDRPARARLDEARQLTEAAEQARAAVLPALARLEESFQQHGLSSAWAREAAQALTRVHDQVAREAVQGPIQDRLKDLQSRVHELVARIETTLQQDEQRRTTAPALVEKVEASIASAREDLAGPLGVEPRAVLREPERDPDVPLQQARAHLDQVKVYLEAGDIEKAGQELENTRARAASALDLVDQTRQALERYPATLKDLEERQGGIVQDGPQHRQPLDELRRRYAPEVFEQVAPLVGAEGSLLDALEHASRYARQAEEGLQQARDRFRQADVLTARDTLAEVDKAVQAGQAHLDAVPAAARLLEEKQAAVLTRLQQLEEHLETTRESLADPVVRPRTRERVREVARRLREARDLAGAEPRTPFASEQAARVAATLLERLDGSRDQDLASFQEATRAQQQAESALAAAKTRLSTARREDLTEYVEGRTLSESLSPSDLAGAERGLARAGEALARIAPLLACQDYEGATAEGRKAAEAATEAEGLAHRAVEAAHVSLERQARSVRWEAERERELERDRERRERERYSSWHSSDSGRSGHRDRDD
ncbi:MAG: hypothetical protein AB1758_00400, partial [Candidatus Eremiobacterota bacterium]